MAGGTQTAASYILTNYEHILMFRYNTKHDYDKFRRGDQDLTGVCLYLFNFK